MPSAKRTRTTRTRKRTPEESSSCGLSGLGIASNDDLLSEILLRLPVKSLLRFKSVSKQWLSLISDPHFIRRKSLQSNPAVSVLMLNNDHLSHINDVIPLKGKARLTSLTFAEPPHHGMAILSSCKGLLLCGTSLRFYSSEAKYHIYSPSTRQFRTFPPLPPPSPPVQAAQKIQVMGFCLPFDPPKSQIYRVACTQRLSPPSDQFEFVVYSSETGRWRVSGAPLPLPLHENFHHAIYCHGAVHWIPADKGVSLCFDLDKELAREIPLPRPSTDSRSPKEVIAYFGESDGHLHLVQVDWFTTRFPIHEMARDCSGWFVKFGADFSSLLSRHPDMYSQFLYLARGEKDEDSFFVMHLYNKVIRFNFANTTEEVLYSTNSRRKLIQCNFSERTQRVIGKPTSRIKLYLGWRHVYQYIENFSLV